MSRIDVFLTNAFVRLVATGFVGLANVISGARFHFPLTVSYLSAVMYSSIGALTIASTIYYYLLGEEEATVISSSSPAVPMIAFISGWLLLDETIETVFLVLFLLFGLLDLSMLNDRSISSMQTADKPLSTGLIISITPPSFARPEYG